MSYELEMLRVWDPTFIITEGFPLRENKNS